MENSEEKKKVDESWKEAVEKEKVVQGEKPAKAQEEALQVSFGLFLSGLMIEGLIGLGEVENPITKKKEVNLEHVKYIIELIAMLQEKTVNNLTADEKSGVEQVLYELRMRFVTKK